MSTNFPTSKQTIPNPSAVDLVENADDTLDHDYQHSTINDTVEALQDKVGIDGDATNTSHDFKLSGVSDGDKAVSLTGSETISNKTIGASTAIALGSDAEGDMYYRDSNGDFVRRAIGNTDDILTVSGGVPVWAANPATTDASTTERGVVEKATAAEINAGTATGGAGTLAVTPDGLASSDYKTESEINSLISTAIGNEPINSTVFAQLTDATGGVTSVAANLRRVTMADSTDTSAYATVYVPAGGTLDSIELLMVSGNTTGDIVFDYEFNDVVDGTSTSDTLTGDVAADISGTNPNYHTIPSTAYNGLTRGRVWGIKVTRKGSDGSDTAATTISVAGIKVNIS